MKHFVNSAHGALLRGMRKAIAADPALACLLGHENDRKLPTLVIEGLDTQPWASATFTGGKHWLELRLEGATDGLEAISSQLADTLVDVEVDVPGHILADIALVDRRIEACEEQGRSVCRMTLEALTIED